jgi:hypothetical protein
MASIKMNLSTAGPGISARAVLQKGWSKSPRYWSRTSAVNTRTSAHFASPVRIPRTYRISVAIGSSGWWRSLRLSDVIAHGSAHPLYPLCEERVFHAEIREHESDASEQYRAELLKPIANDILDGFVQRFHVASELVLF